MDTSSECAGCNERKLFFRLPRYKEKDITIHILILFDTRGRVGKEERDNYDNVDFSKRSNSVADGCRRML